MLLYLILGAGNKSEILYAYSIGLIQAIKGDLGSQPHSKKQLNWIQAISEHF